MQADAPTLAWSTARHYKSAIWPRQEEQTWSDFLEWLDPEHPAPKKDVHPWVGGTLVGGKRTAETVELRHILTLDADYASPGCLPDIGMELKGVPYSIHSTWRSTDTAPRYRLIIPLAYGVTAQQYEVLAKKVVDLLGQEMFDRTTVQAERFMWGPSTQDPETYFYQSYNPNEPYLLPDRWGPLEVPSDSPSAEAELPLGEATVEEKERAEEILMSAVADVLFLREREKFAGRNEAVFHLLPLLMQFVAAGALEEERVLEDLWEASQLVVADEPYLRNEFEVSVQSARQYATREGPQLPESTPTKRARSDFEKVFQAEREMWERTDQLKHVAQAADRYGRNRKALLLVLLLRILAEAPPGICLPGADDGGIGDRAVLNLGVALVGAPGQGKTTFIKGSQRLLNVNQDLITRVPSTGQGLVQQYFMWDKDLGGQVLVPDPRRLFSLDEIDKMSALASDQGSTLMSEIRSLLSGATTGSSNASKDRDRILHANTYNFQLLLGVQPARAGALLAGQSSGTPQRFIWVTMTDPANAILPADRPSWPGPLDWDPRELFMPFDFGTKKYVDYPAWLKAELEQYDYLVSLEDYEGSEYSRFGHKNLLRLKVAAGIAFLHGSRDIEDEHIEIGDLLISSSEQVQDACQRSVNKATLQGKTAAARMDVQVKETLEEDRLQQLVNNTRRRLKAAAGEWIPKHKLRLRLEDRDKYTKLLWEALEAAPDIEVEERPHGTRTDRWARMKPDQEEQE